MSCDALNFRGYETFIAICHSDSDFAADFRRQSAGLARGIGDSSRALVADSGIFRTRFHWRNFSAHVVVAGDKISRAISRTDLRLEKMLASRRVVGNHHRIGVAQCADKSRATMDTMATRRVIRSVTARGAVDRSD